MGEYECRNAKALMNLDWNTYAYTQILAEIVTSLFPEGERDEEVYQLLKAYAETIDYKDVRTATIIAGWQLIASAGFFPDIDRLFVYRKGRLEEGLLPERLSPSLLNQWKSVCTYTWRDEPLRLTAGALQYLEEFLYSYTVQCSERELKSLSALTFS